MTKPEIVHIVLEQDRIIVTRKPFGVCGGKCRKRTYEVNDKRANSLLKVKIGNKVFHHTHSPHFRFVIYRYSPY